MAQRATVIFGDQIDISAAGLGLAKDGSDNFEVLVDDDSIEIAAISGIGNALRLKDDGVKENHLDISNAPTDGYILTWNDGLQQFTWVDVATIIAMEIGLEAGNSGHDNGASE